MLAVFDVESTVSAREFWDQFPSTRDTAKRVIAGKLDFRRAMEARFESVGGTDLERFKAKGKRITARPGAKRLFDKLRKEGFTIALVSGGFDFFVRPIAQKTGVKHWLANRVKSRDGKVVGFREPLVDPRAKRTYVRRLARRLIIPMSRVVVVGDGANDLEMMKVAGLSIAFNAPKRVRAGADIAMESKDIMRLLGPIQHYASKVKRGKQRGSRKIG